jgi:antitoxin StbD
MIKGVTMESLLTNLTASLTELREPNKVIAKAGKQPVAILNRNEAIGYFVPKSAVEDIKIIAASNDQVKAFLEKKLPQIDHVLDYLKDK